MVLREWVRSTDGEDPLEGEHGNPSTSCLENRMKRAWRGYHQ